MKKFFVVLFISVPLFAQQIQSGDPSYNSSPVVNDIRFTVEKYFPFFSNSIKPFSTEYGIKITDQEGKYTAYFYFKEQFSPPTYDAYRKIIRFYYPESYYNYIMKRLDDNVTAYITFKDFKDGHTWGEIYFDKYPR
jgi:hypothetical protein